MCKQLCEGISLSHLGEESKHNTPKIGVSFLHHQEVSTPLGLILPVFKYPGSILSRCKSCRSSFTSSPDIAGLGFLNKAFCLLKRSKICKPTTVQRFLQMQKRTKFFTEIRYEVLSLYSINCFWKSKKGDSVLPVILACCRKLCEIKKQTHKYWILPNQNPLHHAGVP